MTAYKGSKIDGVTIDIIGDSLLCIEPTFATQPNLVLGPRVLFHYINWFANTRNNFLVMLRRVEVPLLVLKKAKGVTLFRKSNKQELCLRFSQRLV